MSSTKPTRKTQSTLSFAQVKSSAPSLSTKAKANQQSATARTPSVTSAASIIISSDEEEEEEIKEVATRARVGQASSSKAVEPAPGTEELDPKAARWNAGFKWAKEQMGEFTPIHKDKKDKVDHILRVFDNSHEYGPCVGITRLQRWERANELGLEPPVAVRDILLTRQGMNDDAYKQSCFNDLADVV